MPDKLIKEVYIQKGISKKNGNTYFSLVTVFTNGYELKTFLSNEQVFILGQIVPVKE